MIHEPRYGRLFDDFVPGEVFSHPWEVTIDEGMLALFAASFQDALPTYASRTYARELGLKDRPVHPLLLLDLALAFSVHDVSERAISHLGYLDVRFPEACYAGDTVVASSEVVGVKAVSSGDKGIVHVRTQLFTDQGARVCAFDRKALVPAGRVADRRTPPPAEPVTFDRDPPRAPAVLCGPLPPRSRRGGFAWFWEDFTVGDVIVHSAGRTVGESEHMQLSTLFRNSHPLHLDEHLCKTHSFAKTRVVNGGLVLSWVLALSSRDTAGNAVWDLGLDEGAHPSGVFAGDTLYAVSRVLAKEETGPDAGSVTLRVVGVKNATPRSLLDKGADLFTAELGKTSGKVPEKVVEITRTLLIRRREGAKS